MSYHVENLIYQPLAGSINSFGWLCISVLSMILVYAVCWRYSRRVGDGMELNVGGRYVFPIAIVTMLFCYLMHGWNLESYVFYKRQSGDYSVSVTAGDRTTGGSREFFITPYCFEAKTYEELLDRYLMIVPDYSFGLGKKELLPDGKLKKFLVY